MFGKRVKNYRKAACSHRCGNVLTNVWWRFACLRLRDDLRLDWFVKRNPFFISTKQKINHSSGVLVTSGWRCCKQSSKSVNFIQSQSLDKHVIETWCDSLLSIDLTGWKLPRRRLVVSAGSWLSSRIAHVSMKLFPWQFIRRRHSDVHRTLSIPRRLGHQDVVFTGQWH